MFGLFKRKLNVPQDYTVPSQMELEDFYENGRYTPDLPLLAENLTHNIFIYGRQMLEHPGHKIINEHSVRLMKAFTSEKYQCWQTILGEFSYPIAIDAPSPDVIIPWAEHRGSPLAQIEGELHTIFTSGLIKLDKDMFNTIEFERVKVRLTIPYRPVVWTKESGTTHGPRKFARTTAFMYIGRQTYWDKILDGGFYTRPVQLMPPKHSDGEPYYYFTKEGYKTK